MNNILRKIVLTAALTGCYPFCLIYGQSTYGTEQFISSEKVMDAFTISASGKSARLLISSKEWPGVTRAFRDLQTDKGYEFPMEYFLDLGRKLQWDPDIERFKDDAEADSMLSRPQRAPYGTNFIKL